VLQAAVSIEKNPCRGENPSSPVQNVGPESTMTFIGTEGKRALSCG
jgi:hypothetical protein